jgi:transglutaminase-like putative cysteine protease
MEKNAQRWWDWPAIVFLLLALFCTSARLQTTNWTEHLGLVQLLVVGGALLGMVLGLSKFRPRFAFFYALIMTIVAPSWALANLIRSDAWLERVGTLYTRLGLTLKQLFSAQAVRDPVLFLMAMVLLFWLCGLVAGYRLVRYANPWGALAVTGLVALIVEYSFDMYNVPDPGTAFSLFFLLFCVMLIARIYFLRSQRDWQSHGHLVENEVGFDLGRSAAIAGVLLLAAAWYSPRIVKSFTPGTDEQKSLSGDLQRFRDRFDKAVSSLRSPAPLVVQSMGDTLSLGSGSELSAKEVLTAAPLHGELHEGRYYWTGRIYDTYQHEQWEASQEQQTAVGPTIPVINYKWDQRLEVAVDLNSQTAYLGTLYFTGAVESVSREALAVSGPTQRGEADITALVIQPPLRMNETYRVVASIALPTIEAMKESDAKPYPDWVLKSYVQLPNDFSPRIRQLAREVTQGKETAYEKVDAVTNYLRSNITYEKIIPTIPAGDDPLEWFLFVHKAGFCNYYASAEVTMLRSLNIPARMVVGYAQGAWSDADKRYHIEAKDFHAWPEIYFPGIGWVPFEPTAGQPVLTYPNAVVNTATSSSGRDPVVTPDIIDRSHENRADLDLPIAPRNMFLVYLSLYGPTAGIVLLAGLVAFGIYRLLEEPIRSKKPLVVFVEETLRAKGWRVPRWLRDLARLARRSPMEKLFANVGDVLKVWGKPPEPDQTPAEQVETLSGLVPEVAGQAAVLLQEYHRASYSRHEVDFTKAKQAADELRSVGYQTWMNRRKRGKIT